MRDKTATPLEAGSTSFAIEVSEEPLQLMADELAARQRGEFVTRSERLEPDSHFLEYETGTTREGYARGEREQAEREDSGEAIIEASHDPRDRTWPDYCRRMQAWRGAVVQGGDPGPKPEPPPSRCYATTRRSART
jgi:hypothetical protein